MTWTDANKRRAYDRMYYRFRRKKQRQEKKAEAVRKLGGKCSRCGYEKCLDALQFHHRDKASKDFEIADTFRSWDKILKELKKCDLLCANCHFEEHARRGSQVA